MTSATSKGGSTGYAKPKQTAKGAAGKNNEGMRQTFKQTGEIAGLKAAGVANTAGRAPVAPTSWGGGGSYHSSHKGNPY